MKTSLTGVGALMVTVINFVFPFFGIEVEPFETEAFVLSILNVVGFVSLIWGQARRPEVTNFLFKK
jgi:hypothetical protein